MFLVKVQMYNLFANGAFFSNPEEFDSQNSFYSPEISRVDIFQITDLPQTICICQLCLPHYNFSLPALRGSFFLLLRRL
jgi:hypothetical protein